MKPARVILLLVALVAGGLAAFLVMRSEEPRTAQPAVAEVVQEPRTRVLAAATTIGVGERLSSSNLEWIDWPQGAVRAEYVTSDAMPEAPTELAGAVARFEFFPGEPIREQKLVRTDQGYLSAVLAEGMRGVSLPVSATSGAGGFIVPNDRVDLVLTRANESGTFSEVVLSNVRVLAIGQRLGEVGATGGETETATGAAPTAQTFTGDTIATIELTPRQAETAINSMRLGSLSLVLRSVADFDENPIVAQRDNASQAVRLIRYGVSSNVTSASAGQAPVPAGAMPDSMGMEGMPMPTPMPAPSNFTSDPGPTLPELQ